MSVKHHMNPSALLARRRSQSSRILRLAMLGGALGWVFQSIMRPLWLPAGRAFKMINRPTYGKVDPTNDSLTAKHGKLAKIIERTDGEKLLKGAETIIFSSKGTMFTLTEQANLVKLSDFETLHEAGNGKPKIITAATTLVATLGNGRPLGGCFTPDDSYLYIADAVLGLTRLKNPGDPKSKVEIVATRVMDNGTMTRLFYPDDVVVGPKTGRVYFTDSSEFMPERNSDLTWDVVYPSVLEFVQARLSGRLLQYDPSTEEVTVLARNLFFANGVTVDKDEKYILFVETFALRLVKYYLTGEKQGTMENLVDGAPSAGYFDGVDCPRNGNAGKTTHCYVVNVSNMVAAAKLVWAIPHPFDMYLRTVLLALPKYLLPKPEPYGGVLVIDPESSTPVVKLLQDPSGRDISHVGGVTIYNNKLYLGSLTNDFVGVYDLS